MMASGDAGWARVPAILSFPDTAAFAETYGFSAASGTVWLEGQFLIPRGRPLKTMGQAKTPLPPPAASALPSHMSR